MRCVVIALDVESHLVYFHRHYLLDVTYQNHVFFFFDCLNLTFWLLIAFLVLALSFESHEHLVDLVKCLLGFQLSSDSPCCPLLCVVSLLGLWQLIVHDLIEQFIFLFPPISALEEFLEVM